MSGRTRDMTTGSPAKHIIAFALPLMLGNIFQQLYTVTDAAIVGQFAGANALGAIGSADWLCWLAFGVVSGFMQGFSILVSQRFGSGDVKLLRRAVSTSVIMGGAIALVLCAAGLISVEPLLRLMRTQKLVYGEACDYLYILFACIPVTAMYNILSAFLRALGNSRTPLVAMVAASVANIALDLLFVVVFRWSVAGAAAATVIAQGFAALICLYTALKMPQLRLSKSDIAFSREDSRVLIRLSMPMAFQNFMISAGGMAVQTVINSLGLIFVNGFTATNKLYGVFEAAAIAFGYGVTTYTGQNIGAGDIKRIRRGVRSAVGISFATACAVSALMFIFGGDMLRLFIEKSADPGVMRVAKRYLFTMSAPLFILYFLYVYRSALQGMGNTLMPMLSGLGECVMRVGAAWLLTLAVGESGIYYAEPLAWLGAEVILMAAYYADMRKRRLSITAETENS